ncbi:flagellar biosynthesis repressor FlbT [Mangrovicoccus sp. HB161399]|uniref:flagellar biosynthesis repressor FlbT n=1 Tax=Mangrovicoccus sp. HB161399 TaxID=2720392 RepID=UPI001553FE96|nr:flagellar biosynthesis repressor FlbT [Mangrovicoccus sp. HB161399]
MTGLVLKLGPRERVLINGAVIENGDRRSRINIVTPNVKILRLRDAIHPDDVSTPVQKVCYVVQLILSGDTTPEVVRADMIDRIEELSQVFRDSDSRRLISDASSAFVGKNFYQCLKALRALLPREERLIQRGR